MKRKALILGAVTVATLASPLALAPGSASAAIVRTCNGFTEADATALGYVVFVGGPGNDNYVNLNPVDWNWVWTAGGQDTIQTSDGNDMICGMDGNDTIDSGDGFDSVYGGAGNDTIDLGDGLFDFAEGGADNDTINGQAGPDAIYGDEQSSFSTASGKDTISGGADADALNGGPEADSIAGNAGDDTLDGDDGADDLKGGDDVDTADGGGGLLDTCVAETVVNCP